MQLINGLPKYSIDKQPFNIIFYKERDNEGFPYWYFSPIDCIERAWGTLRDYQNYYNCKTISLEPLHLKHLFSIGEPIKDQKKEFVIAFINDLIADIKDNHK